ncbi:concanavalin A-like lectin/glucanase domain-containing protein [Cercophora newfieldiana]|uniref:Concanavalin A-like lectin/glucanase domain-containing protein n=1 Tax=Cercophora newfieldiana TaxID=92897 RepID=A0AA39Y7K7_9PEZI|nr:concanavalin A-like lectin/glucanase domain-containing protein [Cercophora newfieldiana]
MQITQVAASRHLPVPPVFFVLSDRCRGRLHFSGDFAPCISCSLLPPALEFSLMLTSSLECSFHVPSFLGRVLFDLRNAILFVPAISISCSCLFSRFMCATIDNISPSLGWLIPFVLAATSLEQHGFWRALLCRKLRPSLTDIFVCFFFFIPIFSILLPYIMIPKRLATAAADRSAMTTKSWALLLLLGSALPSVPLVAADCDCGYSFDMTAKDPVFFTDLLESNFQRMRTIHINDNTDWRRQEYNLTAEKSRGPFGKMMDVDNVELVPDPEYEPQKRALKLVVSSSLYVVEGMIPDAEIASERTDIMYGSFSVSMKVTDVPGTCSAFFWYFSDTQEIDMEFLSKDFNSSNSSWPVNLVLQSRDSAKEGFDASRTSNFHRVYLPYNPAQDYHIYRIDYLKDRVSFYMDDILLKHFDGPDAAIPNTAGHLILQHWSNGDPMWSGGPPRKEAAMFVRWVKAYFNSSLPQRTLDWENRCKEFKPEKLCNIPSGSSTKAAIGSRGPTWFYTENPGFAKNQTFFDSEASTRREWSWPWASLLVGVWVWALL